MMESIDQKRIAGFNGAFRFLSNFWPVDIEFEGKTYPTVEHAYQAAKSTDLTIREFISRQDSPGAAKHVGRSIVLRDDWDDVKIAIMRTLLRKKFYDPVLRTALSTTGDAELIEENYWHDNFWGQCICEKHKNSLGSNWLGRLLMEVRTGL